MAQDARHQRLPWKGVGGDQPGHGRPVENSRREAVEPLVAVLEDVRSLGGELERSYEVVVRGRLKFRVGQIVYVASLRTRA